MPLPNAPKPLSETSSGSTAVVFPSDLLPSGVINTSNNNSSWANSGTTRTSSAGFYTLIQAVPANSVYTGQLSKAVSMSSTTPATSSGVANPVQGVNSVYLPLPKSINDIEIQSWEDVSMLNMVPMASDFQKLYTGFSAMLGSPSIINPFLYNLYKQPQFRHFKLQWSFSPQSQKESDTLLKILYMLKTAALPAYSSAIAGMINFISDNTGSSLNSNALSGIALDYPWLLLIKFNPNAYLFEFKPCCIISVEISDALEPMGLSFYNSGAPTIVNLSLHVKETEILTRSDTSKFLSDNSLTSGM